jgi:DNA-binding CsgD family transcriptional regulator
MHVPIYQEATKIWKKLSGGLSTTSPEPEQELSKKLQAFFQVGDYYYFVFNSVNASFEYLSPEVEKVLGYRVDQVDVPFVLSVMHPHDQPYFLNFENKAREFFTNLNVAQLPNYKMRYDFRLRCSDGRYIRLLQQTAALHWDEEGNVQRILGVHTDITHIKEHGAPVLSFIGLDGEPSYINVDVTRIFPVPNDLLSRREKEVLGLLIDGKTSAEIAQGLGISEATVHTHRKNMLRKGGVSNSSQLIAKAIREGWV